MEDFVSAILFPSLLCGVIFAVAGAIMYLYPPKKINYLYGYRTKASMLSQERWDFSQKFSAVQMIKSALVMIVLSLLAYFIPAGEGVKAVAGVALIIASSIYMFIVTEKALKKKFQN